MKIENKVKQFEGMIRSVYPICFFEFDRDFNIVRCVGDEAQTEFVKKYYCQANSFKRLKAQALKSDAPMLIATEAFGVEMGVVIYDHEDDWRTFIIGPIFSAESASVDVDYVLLQYVKNGKRVDSVSLKFRKQMVEAMKSFPVLSANLFSNIIIMMEYFINGRTVSSGDLLRDTKADTIKKPAAKKNRQRVYQSEQALLSMVRNGDLNYRSVMQKATGISTGVQINPNEPLRQARISVETFITLCVRAAIEGSLSPELAYSYGDSYIAEVEKAPDMASVMDISRRMYEDFIKLVHQQRMNPEISPDIQNIMNYIEVHTGEVIKITQLAKIAGYTEYYLSRKFKKETHYSINDYIAVTRVERAKVLLTTTEFSISTIADTLNFCTSSYFTTVFRKYTDMAPNEYRDQTKSNSIK